MSQLRKELLDQIVAGNEECCKPLSTTLTFMTYFKKRISLSERTLNQRHLLIHLFQFKIKNQLIHFRKDRLTIHSLF